MNVTDDVLNDLLRLYLAGGASADTRSLLEEHAGREPAFAAKMQAATPPAGVERRTLLTTRQAIFMRTLFVAAAVFLTLVPLGFLAAENGLFRYIRPMQAGILRAFWFLAFLAWINFWLMNRQVRRAGL
jgi:hypothetical protein